MKRINITRVAPVLAFLASALMASALTGCAGETTSTEQSDESSIVSDRAHNVANAEEATAAFSGGPTQALELKTRTDDEGQGPHPEPWLDQEGPHPEPWQSKNLSYSPPDPNNQGNNKP
jgi:hypothetical protein